MNTVARQLGMITVQIPTVSMDSAELEALLERAAARGAQQAIDSMVSFNYKETCKQLGISYNTLQARLVAGKIHSTDGRISAAEIRRYLTQKRSN